jgi:A/G-specific adenine glycosylase
MDMGKNPSAGKTAAMGMSNVSNFVDRIWRFHAKNRRDMPWRDTKDPYRVLISELMLQQTQVSRVLQKYDEFLINFPDLRAVHKASMPEILRVWKGLGYNRRAFFIKKIADILHARNPTKGANPHSPIPFPTRYEDLIKLPGIGQSTAGALVAFCFAAKTGQKIAFIETNIRLVFIHEFFNDKKPLADAGKKSHVKIDGKAKISDKSIAEKLQACLDRIEPKDIREWYYALYDYGTHLKGTLGREKTALHKKSSHYARQTAFKGSVREMRARILDILTKRGSMRQAALQEIAAPDKTDVERFDTALARLIADNSISIKAKNNDRNKNTKSAPKPGKRDIMEIC